MDGSKLQITGLTESVKHTSTHAEISPAWSLNPSFAHSFIFRAKFTNFLICVGFGTIHRYIELVNWVHVFWE